MAVSVSYPAVWDDQGFYPLHEEDDVSEIPPHRRWVTYLYNAIEARFPAWFVTSNVCIYWEPGATAVYRAPDLLVVKEPLAEAVERVYQTWRQPPVAFVAEIGSRSTQRIDEGPKVEIYQDQVRAGEYYYADPPKGDQRLWRLGPHGYEAVAPAAGGRLRSKELGLEFALEEGGVRLYTLEGDLLLSRVETDAAWQEAERLRQEEAQRRQEAERLRQEEAQRRQEAERLRQAAEARQVEEARLRQEAERLRQAAEARQVEEARLRQAAEARVAELERRLAELRARQGDG